MANVSTRIKLRKQEINIIKENIRKSLPILNRAQIRRYRIPYHEALCLELEEDGCTKSAHFIRSLVKYQDNLRSKSSSESIVWSRPLLKDHKDMMDELYKGLRAAELASRNDQLAEECDSFLKLGVFYSKGPDDWWWLGEHLLMIAMSFASLFEEDGGKRHALSKYLYGRYLLLQAKNADKAREHLRISRLISIGHDWSAEELLQLPQDSLYKESSSLLYQALLTIARRIKEVEPVEAIKVCLIAKKRASDAEDEYGEAECLMELGMCNAKAGDTKSALKRFNKVLIMRNALNEHAGVCDTYMKIASAHVELGNFSDANQSLLVLLEYSKEHQLNYYYGQALRLLGEFHINHAHAHEATKYLTEALQVFHELDDYDNREQVKNLAAISAGQELLGKYRMLVQGCSDTKEGQLNITKMVNWKDSRETFWDTTNNTQINVNIFKQKESITQLAEAMDKIINNLELVEANGNSEDILENKKYDGSVIKDIVRDIQTDYVEETDLLEPNVITEENKGSDVEIIMGINKNINFN